MSRKNAPTADERSLAIIHSNDTSKTNTNSLIRCTFVNFAIDDIERKTRWQRTKAYNIVARAECLSVCWKHQRLRMSLVHMCHNIPANICLTLLPRWVNHRRAFHNKRNAINYCNYKCSIYWIHPRMKARRKRNEKKRDNSIFSQF